MNLQNQSLRSDTATPRPLAIPLSWTMIVTETFRKLSPRAQLKNPVMFVVYLRSIATTLLWVQALRGKADAPAGFIFAVTVWLWFTVLFANAAEALAEGRGKAQAAALQGAKKRVFAKVLNEPRFDSTSYPLPSDELVAGKIVLVEAGDMIPTTAR